MGGGGSGSRSVNSYAEKVNEAGSVVGVSSQNLGGNSGGYKIGRASCRERV